MRTALTDAVARRGLYDGIILGCCVMVGLFVANVVVPVADQDYPAKYAVDLVLLVLVGVLFMVIGARGRRRANTDMAGSGTAGARAGAVAGFVVAVLSIVTFVIMDNVFFAVIVQQPYKIGATRASLTATLLPAGVFMLVSWIVIGALLGQLGGSIVETRIAKISTDG
jgi:uncharacterized membrane protein YfcA